MQAEGREREKEVQEKKKSEEKKRREKKGNNAFVSAVLELCPVDGVMLEASCLPIKWNIANRISCILFII